MIQIMLLVACVVVASGLDGLAQSPGLGANEQESWVRFVRLSNVEGPAKIDRLRGDGFERAFSHMPVEHGMRLRTLSSGQAEVQFEDKKTVLRLAENTDIQFSELKLLASGERTSTVKVEAGAVHVKFRGKMGEQLRLSLAGSEVHLEDSAEFHARFQDHEVQLAVVKGEVKVQGQDEAVTVRANEILHFGSTGELATARVKRAERED